MAASRKNLYERYQPLRRPVEWSFWLLVMGLQATFNTTVALLDARARATAEVPWQIVVAELTSHLALLLLVPAVAAFERRVPLTRLDGLGRNLLLHLPASMLFSLAHVALMVALRHAAFAAVGERYAFGGGLQWGYEYLKDARTYVLLVGVIAAYRFFLLRLQGEARLLDAPEPAGDLPPPPADDTDDAAAAPPGTVHPAPPDPAPTRPERFLVRKLRREFLIAAVDIDWLQAQGNYVSLRVNGHDYLLRTTLTEFLGRLDPATFARVHRSHAVNLGALREIEPLEGGDARLHLRDGSVVPCSRRYRDALRHNAHPVA